MRVFRHSNESTVTGCTAHPGHERKCPLHRNDDSPVLEFVPNTLKQKMRVKRTRSKVATENDDEREDDEVFIVEKILKRKQDQYLIQCVGYEPEWMEAAHIPSFLLEHFHATGKSDIPLPYINSSSTTGSITFQSLSWKSDGSLTRWSPTSEALFPCEDLDQAASVDQAEGYLKCNTRKDKAGQKFGLIKYSKI